MLLQLLQRNADYYPDETAIVYANKRITHAELLSTVERLAHGFSQLGVVAGDRVALFLENRPEYIAGFFANVACRAVNLPLSIETRQEELEFYLKDAGTRLIVVDEQRAELALRAVAALPHEVEIVVTGEPDTGMISFEELLAGPAGAQSPPGNLSDDVVHMYSSGTTGRPKCVPRTLLQYWWEMDDVVECLRLTREDTIFCTIPLSHNFGAVQCMLMAAGAGAKVVILDHPNPFALRRARALQLLESEKVTIFPCVPFVLDQLARSSTDADLSSIRVCYSAAAALPREVAEAFRAKYGIPVRQHYGCTEVGAITLDLDTSPSTDAQCVGHPLPGVRVRILDDDGEELPPEATGNVVVGARQMTRGYLGTDETNAEFFRNGYFHTGDLGRLDEDGRLYLMGRKKFVIDVVGQKVSPMEVEDVLTEHADVAEAVVIGVPNPNGDAEVVHAYVVSGGCCTEADLVAFCRDRLANFKVPQTVQFISAVPKDGLGKVQRKREIIERNIVPPLEERAVERA